MTLLTIGQVARQAGVPVATVRFYERTALIETASRRASGYRQFSARVVDRIRFIRRAQALGFSLADVADLLSLRATTTGTSVEVRAKALSKIADIDQRQKDLRRIKRELTTLVAACVPGRANRACPILSALDQPVPSARNPKESRHGKNPNR